MLKKRKIETTGNFPWKIVLSEDTLLKCICNYSKRMRLNNFFYFLLTKYTQKWAKERTVKNFKQNLEEI